MTSPMEMRMRTSREGIMQCSLSCDGNSYYTALGENGCTDIVSCQMRHSSMVRRWYGHALKDVPMVTTKSVVVDCPWWRQNWWKMCGKQIYRIGASQFRNSLVDFPGYLAYFCTKSSPCGRKTFPQRQCGTDGSDFMALVVGGVAPMTQVYQRWCTVR